MEVSLDITAHNPSQRPDQIIHLSGVRTSYSVRHTHSVHADLVDCPVDGEEVDELGSERVFGGEPDFNALGLDEFDYFDSAER